MRKKGRSTMRDHPSPFMNARARFTQSTNKVPRTSASSLGLVLLIEAEATGPEVPDHNR